MSLRVYNYARVDSASLASSEKVADAIFANAGISIAWADCPTSRAKLRAYPACEPQMGTSDFVLRILPRQMAMRLHTPDEPLGFAQACPQTEPACELTLFYHRVDELAAKGYRADRILGHAIAHEVAHILIGPGHSDEGIMRREWTALELQRISWGMQLNFTREQCEQLLDAALRRSAAPVQVQARE